MNISNLLSLDAAEMNQYLLSQCERLEKEKEEVESKLERSRRETLVFEEYRITIHKENSILLMKIAALKEKAQKEEKKWTRDSLLLVDLKHNVQSREDITSKQIKYNNRIVKRNIRYQLEMGKAKNKIKLLEQHLFHLMRVYLINNCHQKLQHFPPLPFSSSSFNQPSVQFLSLETGDGANRLSPSHDKDSSVIRRCRPNSPHMRRRRRQSANF